ncbi:MAG: glycosyltransferase family 2 protein [Burkholderiaceae bacterium]|nr:glycosyltransferase family 2 protein [Microbacteriaceae bacterium]
MPDSQPALAVVIVNFGSHDLIEPNVLGLDLDWVSSRVVIVDNFRSADDSAAIAEVCARHGWALVRNPVNLGFGAAMNVGVARARELGCSVFLLLNPDASIERDSLEELYERAVADPLALRSPRVDRPDGTRWFDGATVLIRQGRTSTAAGSISSAPFGWISGACLVVHEELWERVGGFDESFFLYWDDVDLSWRCVEVGGRLVVDSDLVAVHSVGGTQRGAGKSALYVFHNCRNRLVFAGIHLTRVQTLRWILGSWRYAWAVVNRGGRREFARNAVPLAGAAVGGTVAGATWAIVRMICAVRTTA